MASVVKDEKASSVFKVRIFAGKDRKWYYDAVARNGRVLSRSQAYSRRGDAIRLAQRAYPIARLVVED